MSARTTSADVARAAGVSQSAVSRVFSGASASAATARKVRAAADRLGYRPNAMARTLITGRSRLIGVALGYMENQFYPEALTRLSQALEAEGYGLLVFLVGEADDMDEITARMLDHQVDGIVAASVPVTGGLARRCAAAGIPVVLFNRGADVAGISQVTSANRAGGARVAEFLLAGGHARIAQITGWRGASTGRDRAEGFRGALAAAGTAPVAEADGAFDRAVAGEAAAAMWAAHRPDAIFVGNDHMAFGVIDALRAAGASVGRDVSVVGYDDVAAAAWGAYDLTTVRQCAEQMTAAAVRTVLARIADPAAPPERTEIDGPLIVRGSTRPRQETR